MGTVMMIKQLYTAFMALVSSISKAIIISVPFVSTYCVNAVLKVL